MAKRLHFFLMQRLLVIILASAAVALTPAVAAADVTNATGTNAQEGDNSSSSRQVARGGSGDAVAGQVVGIVASGEVSVDATNQSLDIDVETGDATGTTSSAFFVGLNFAAGTVLADIANVTATNLQEGDNTFDQTQTADAVSGDGVGGQVTGVVTPSGGTAVAVLDNLSDDVSLETGDVLVDDRSSVFVGLVFETTPPAPPRPEPRQPDDPPPPPPPPPPPAVLGCTITAVEVQTGRYDVTVDCDADFTDFTMTFAAGAGFVDHADPPGFTCTEAGLTTLSCSGGPTMITTKTIEDSQIILGAGTVIDVSVTGGGGFSFSGSVTLP